jgi:hypothetical protein
MAAPFLTKVHVWSEKVQSDSPNHRHAHPSRNHPRHEGYALSQRIRKRIEEVFGSGKTVGPLAQTRLRGTERVGARSSPVSLFHFTGDLTARRFA